MMDKAERTALARRVGHMAYEQVRPLFEEAQRQQDERRGCPDCHYITGSNWHHCDEYEALCEANKGHIMQIYKQLRDHEKNCPNCYVKSHWKEFESHCEKCEELHDLFRLYAHRLTCLETNEQKRLFAEEHGRKPATPLELAEWQDAKYTRIEVATHDSDNHC